MWVLVILAGLIILFLLVLCVPVDAVFEWDSMRRQRMWWRLHWLFGLVHFAPGRAKRAEAGRPRKKKAGKKLSLAKVLKIITTRGLFGKVGALVKDSLRQIRVAKLEGDIKIEFDDPADAGFVYAVIGAAYPLLRTTRMSRINIEPVLSEEVSIRGNARAVVRLYPVRLVGPSLKFMFSRPAFSALKTVIAA